MLLDVEKCAGHVGRRLQGRKTFRRDTSKHHGNRRSEYSAVGYDEAQRVADHDDQIGFCAGILVAKKRCHPWFVLRIGSAREIEKLGA